MDRRKFLTKAGVGGTTLLTIHAGASAYAEPQRPCSQGECPRLALRPYQVLCVICSLGGGDVGPSQKKIESIRQSVRSHPDMPVTVACNAGDVYVYQDPGIKDDSPEGRDFNR